MSRDRLAPLDLAPLAQGLHLLLVLSLLGATAASGQRPRCDARPFLSRYAHYAPADSLVTVDSLDQPVEALTIPFPRVPNGLRGWKANVLVVALVNTGGDVVVAEAVDTTVHSPQASPTEEELTRARQRFAEAAVSLVTKTRYRPGARRGWLVWYVACMPLAFSSNR